MDKLNYFRDLLFSGKIVYCHSLKNDEDEVIRLLTDNLEQPEIYLACLSEAAEFGSFGLIPVSLALFFSKIPSFYFENTVICGELFKTMSYLSSDDLFDFMSFMKDKDFGKGLGSREQKAIRRVMESWSPERLLLEIEFNPDQLYELLKYIHPRYSDFRSQTIKNFLLSFKS